MKKLILVVVLLLPVISWANSDVTKVSRSSDKAYRFICQPELGRLSVKVTRLKDSVYKNDYIPSKEHDEQLIAPILEYEMDYDTDREYAVNKGEAMEPRFCEIYGRKFTVEAFGLHNFAAAGRMCSSQGPSLRITVKDEEKVVVNELDFINGCFRGFSINELVYLPDVEKAHGGAVLTVHARNHSKGTIHPYISIGTGEYEASQLDDSLATGSLYKEIRKRLRVDEKYFKEGKSY